MQGTNTNFAQIAFAVSNADSIPAADTALPSLAGPAEAGSSTAFDWGLPSFLGRNIYIGFEGATLAGILAPADAF
jgi:hypothetical protein